MEKKNLIAACLIIITGVIWIGCQKDKKVPITIEVTDVLMSNYLYIGDTIRISYQATEAGLDSVCLFLNDTLNQKRTQAIDEFTIVPTYIFNHRIWLVAYYSSGEKSVSRHVEFTVSPHTFPMIYFNVKRHDGKQSYFVGEQLSINLYGKNGNNLEFVKQLRIFLNDEFLGVATQAPFSFETPIITLAENELKITIIDTADRSGVVYKALTVPHDTPPIIELGFDYIHNVKPGYFFSTDSIFLEISGKDNVTTHYVDYYLNGDFAVRDTVNSEIYYHRRKNIGKFPSGTHKAYCIAYDDRGNSTVSNTLIFKVYGAIDLDIEIMDVVNTDHPNVIYAISSNELYKINPETESIEKAFDLPYQSATCLSYDRESDKLYIGFSNSHLVYFDILTETFGSDLIVNNLNVFDLEIDHEYGVALFISNGSVSMINLNNGEYFSLMLDIKTESTLIVNRTDKEIIAGGNPSSSSDVFFRLLYTPNSLEYIDQKSFYGYADKLLQRPEHDSFVILGSSNNTVKSYNFSNWLEIGSFIHNDRSKIGCYSNSGLTFYLGPDSKNYLNLFGASDFILSGKKYIPLRGFNYGKLMVINSDNSWLILTTTNTLYNDVKIVFIPI
jgi:hypothetical protein